MKIFQTKSTDTIQQCRWYFVITDTKLHIAKRKIKFLAEYCNAQNEKIFADVGHRESARLSTEGVGSGAVRIGPTPFPDRRS